jgi:hypothetical protein
VALKKEYTILHTVRQNAMLIVGTVPKTINGKALSASWKSVLEL